MSDEYYSNLGRKLDKLEKGHIIKLKYVQNKNRFSDNSPETIELVVIDPPNENNGSGISRMTSVIQTVESDADLEKSYEELFKNGVKHVNIQSNRNHKGSGYEIRELNDRRMDGADVVDVQVIGYQDNMPK